MFALKPAVQNYAWGKIGTESAVARLAVGSHAGFELQPDVPYAELWMGTHPKGPATTSDPSIPTKPLKDWLEENPEALGSNIRKTFGDRLPFLFKVLSVNKSLSIQAHPTKEHAEKLHLEKPEHYPDGNHKPEMAIALSRFEGMCGFKPAEKILTHLTKIPELGAVIGDEICDEFEASLAGGDPSVVDVALRKCFTAVMTAQEQVITDHLSLLKDRLSKQESLESGDHETDESMRLFLRLSAWFPGDVGCFVAFFLNHYVLQPGEALFLAPNLPHNYISGDCLECMACSDNVVRAGLTPKFKDVSVLCDMLDYRHGPPSLFPSQRAKPGVTIYNPPVPDFAVERHKVEKSSVHFMEALDSCCIILVVEGEGGAESNGKSLLVHAGSVLFLAANQTIHWSAGTERLLLYRAFCD